ncbi:hypothetical protein HZH68_012670 [Vespula germanica]|uniref:Uncharacterized protein n=1 Tax=Vespula germanica TaxID=30212 RepID=A0A834MZK7_VESGE|nr:hypothetical protein HZH68_012670 [Vespula germanica]
MAVQFELYELIRVDMFLFIGNLDHMISYQFETPAACRRSSRRTRYVCHTTAILTFHEWNWSGNGSGSGSGSRSGSGTGSGSGVEWSGVEWSEVEQSRVVDTYVQRDSEGSFENHAKFNEEYSEIEDSL